MEHVGASARDYFHVPPCNAATGYCFRSFILSSYQTWVPESIFDEALSRRIPFNFWKTGWGHHVLDWPRMMEALNIMEMTGTWEHTRGSHHSTFLLVLMIVFASWRRVEQAIFNTQKWHLMQQPRCWRKCVCANGQLHMGGQSSIDPKTRVQLQQIESRVVFLLSRRWNQPMRRPKLGACLSPCKLSPSYQASGTVLLSWADINKQANSSII